MFGGLFKAKSARSSIESVGAGAGGASTPRHGVLNLTATTSASSSSASSSSSSSTTGGRPIPPPLRQGGKTTGGSTRSILKKGDSIKNLRPIGAGSARDGSSSGSSPSPANSGEDDDDDDDDSLEKRSTATGTTGAGSKDRRALTTPPTPITTTGGGGISARNNAVSSASSDGGRSKRSIAGSSTTGAGSSSGVGSSGAAGAAGSGVGSKSRRGSIFAGVMGAIAKVTSGNNGDAGAGHASVADSHANPRDQDLEDETPFEPPPDGVILTGALEGIPHEGDAKGTVSIIGQGGEFWIQLHHYACYTIPEQYAHDVFLYFCPKKSPKFKVPLPKCVRVHIPGTTESGSFPQAQQPQGGGMMEEFPDDLYFSLSDCMDTRRGNIPIDPRRYASVVILKPGIHDETTQKEVAPTSIYAFANLKKPGSSREEQAAQLADKMRRQSLAMADFNKDVMMPVTLYGRTYADMDLIAKDCFATLGKTKADGSLTFAEFKMVLVTLNVTFTEARAYLWFDVADADGSGEIEFEEFQHLLFIVSRCKPAFFVTLRDTYYFFTNERSGDDEDEKNDVTDIVKEDMALIDVLGLHSLLNSMGIKVSNKKCEKLLRVADSRKGRKALDYEQVKEIYVNLCDPRLELSKRGLSLTKLLKDGLLDMRDMGSLRSYFRDMLSREEKGILDDVRSAVVSAENEQKKLRAAADAKRKDMSSLRVVDDKAVKRHKAMIDREERLRKQREAEAAEARIRQEKELKQSLAGAIANRKAQEDALLKNDIQNHEQEEAEKRVRLGLDRMDISNRGLLYLPALMWSTAEGRKRLGDLVLMDMSHNKIAKLPGMQLLYHCISLQKLDISNNEIEVLPEEVSDLKQLLIFAAHNNLIRNVPTNIGNLTQLRRLTLHANRIESLPESIGKLQSLQILHIEANRLTTLPESLGTLSALKELVVGGNKLEFLPMTFGHGLAGLERLDLRNNLLRELPPSIGKLKKLTHLFLSHNQLRVFPDEIGKLKYLRVLEAGRNKLKHLPASFGKLERVISIDLSENDLKWIDEAAFKKLRGVQKLDLNHNRLVTLPPTIGRLVDLQTLNLSFNKLRSLPNDIAACRLLRHWDLKMNALGSGGATILPSSIGTMTSLEWLDASCNSAEDVTPDLSACPRIKHLNLSNNRLKTLHPSFVAFPLLLSLDLSNNLLTQVPAEIGGSISLRALDLSCNHLRNLPDSISDCASLRHLHVYNNHITILPFSMAWLFPQLISFDVGKNPLAGLPNKWAASEVFGARDVLALRFARERRNPLLVEIRRARARDIFRRIQGMRAKEEDMQDRERMGMLREDYRLAVKGGAAILAELSAFSNRNGWSRAAHGEERDRLDEWLAFIREELDDEKREGLRQKNNAGEVFTLLDKTNENMLERKLEGLPQLTDVLPVKPMRGEEEGENINEDARRYDLQTSPSKTSTALVTKATTTRTNTTSTSSTARATSPTTPTTTTTLTTTTNNPWGQGEGRGRSATRRNRSLTPAEAKEELENYIAGVEDVHDHDAEVKLRYMAGKRSKSPLSYPSRSELIRRYRSRTPGGSRPSSANNNSSSRPGSASARVSTPAASISSSALVNATTATAAASSSGSAITDHLRSISMLSPGAAAIANLHAIHANLPDPTIAGPTIRRQGETGAAGKIIDAREADLLRARSDYHTGYVAPQELRAKELGYSPRRPDTSTDGGGIGDTNNNNSRGTNISSRAVTPGQLEYYKKVLPRPGEVVTDEFPLPPMEQEQRVLSEAQLQVQKRDDEDALERERRLLHQQREFMLNVSGSAVASVLSPNASLLSVPASGAISNNNNGVAAYDSLEGAYATSTSSAYVAHDREGGHINHINQQQTHSHLLPPTSRTTMKHIVPAGNSNISGISYMGGEGRDMASGHHHGGSGGGGGGGADDSISLGQMSGLHNEDSGFLDESQNEDDANNNNNLPSRRRQTTRHRHMYEQRMQKIANSPKPGSVILKSSKEETAKTKKKKMNPSLSSSPPLQQQQQQQQQQQREEGGSMDDNHVIIREESSLETHHTTDHDDDDNDDDGREEYHDEDAIPPSTAASATTTTTHAQQQRHSPSNGSQRANNRIPIPPLDAPESFTHVHQMQQLSREFTKVSLDVSASGRDGELLPVPDRFGRNAEGAVYDNSVWTDLGLDPHQQQPDWLIERQAAALGVPLRHMVPSNPFVTARLIPASKGLGSTVLPRPSIPDAITLDISKSVFAGSSLDRDKNKNARSSSSSGNSPGAEERRGDSREEDGGGGGGVDGGNSIGSVALPDREDGGKWSARGGARSPRRNHIVNNANTLTHFETPSVRLNSSITTNNNTSPLIGGGGGGNNNRTVSPGIPTPTNDHNHNGPTNNTMTSSLAVAGRSASPYDKFGVWRAGRTLDEGMSVPEWLRKEQLEAKKKEKRAIRQARREQRLKCREERVASGESKGDSEEISESGTDDDEQGGSRSGGSPQSPVEMRGGGRNGGGKHSPFAGNNTFYHHKSSPTLQLEAIARSPGVGPFERRTRSPTRRADSPIMGLNATLSHTLSTGALQSRGEDLGILGSSSVVVAASRSNALASRQGFRHTESTASGAKDIQSSSPLLSSSLRERGGRSHSPSGFVPNDLSTFPPSSSITYRAATAPLSESPYGSQQLVHPLPLQGTKLSVNTDLAGGMGGGGADGSLSTLRVSSSSSPGPSSSGVPIADRFSTATAELVAAGGGLDLVSPGTAMNPGGKTLSPLEKASNLLMGLGGGDATSPLSRQSSHPLYAEDIIRNEKAGINKKSTDVGTKQILPSLHARQAAIVAATTTTAKSTAVKNYMMSATEAPTNVPIFINTTTTTGPPTDDMDEEDRQWVARMNSRAAIGSNAAGGSSSGVVGSSSSGNPTNNGTGNNIISRIIAAPASMIASVVSKSVASSKTTTTSESGNHYHQHHPGVAVLPLPSRTDGERKEATTSEHKHDEEKKEENEEAEEEDEEDEEEEEEEEENEEEVEEEEEEVVVAESDTVKPVVPAVSTADTSRSHTPSSTSPSPSSSSALQQPQARHQEDSKKSASSASSSPIPPSSSSSSSSSPSPPHAPLPSLEKESADANPKKATNSSSSSSSSSSLHRSATSAQLKKKSSAANLPHTASSGRLLAANNKNSRGTKVLYNSRHLQELANQRQKAAEEEQEREQEKKLQELKSFRMQMKINEEEDDEQDQEDDDEESESNSSHSSGEDSDDEDMQAAEMLPPWMRDQAINEAKEKRLQRKQQKEKEKAMLHSVSSQHNLKSHKSFANNNNNNDSLNDDAAAAFMKFHGPNSRQQHTEGDEEGKDGRGDDDDDGQNGGKRVKKAMGRRKRERRIAQLQAAGRRVPRWLLEGKDGPDSGEEDEENEEDEMNAERQKPTGEDENDETNAVDGATQLRNILEEQIVSSMRPGADVPDPDAHALKYIEELYRMDENEREYAREAKEAGSLDTFLNYYIEKHGIKLPKIKKSLHGEDDEKEGGSKNRRFKGAARGAANTASEDGSLTQAGMAAATKASELTHLRKQLGKLHRLNAEAQGGSAESLGLRGSDEMMSENIQGSSALTNQARIRALAAGLDAAQRGSAGAGSNAMDGDRDAAMLLLDGGAGIGTEKAAAAGGGSGGDIDAHGQGGHDASGEHHQLGGRFNGSDNNATSHGKRLTDKQLLAAINKEMGITDADGNIDESVVNVVGSVSGTNVRRLRAMAKDLQERTTELVQEASHGGASGRRTAQDLLDRDIATSDRARMRSRQIAKLKAGFDKSDAERAATMDAAEHALMGGDGGRRGKKSGNLGTSSSSSSLPLDLPAEAAAGSHGVQHVRAGKRKDGLSTDIRSHTAVAIDSNLSNEASAAYDALLATGVLGRMQADKEQKLQDALNQAKLLDEQRRETAMSKAALGQTGTDASARTAGKSLLMADAQGGAGIEFLDRMVAKETKSDAIEEHKRLTGAAGDGGGLGGGTFDIALLDKTIRERQAELEGSSGALLLPQIGTDKFASEAVALMFSRAKESAAQRKAERLARLAATNNNNASGGGTTAAYDPRRDPATAIRSDTFDQEFSVLAAPAAGIRPLVPSFGEGVYKGLWKGNPYAKPDAVRMTTFASPGNVSASQQQQGTHTLRKMFVTVPLPEEITGIQLDPVVKGDGNAPASESVRERRVIHERRLEEAAEQVRLFRYVGGVRFVHAQLDSQEAEQEAMYGPLATAPPHIHGIVGPGGGLIHGDSVEEDEGDESARNRRARGATGGGGGGGGGGSNIVNAVIASTGVKYADELEQIYDGTSVHGSTIPGGPDLWLGDGEHGSNPTATTGGAANTSSSSSSRPRSSTLAIANASLLPPNHPLRDLRPHTPGTVSTIDGMSNATTSRGGGNSNNNNHTINNNSNNISVGMGAGSVGSKGHAVNEYGEGAFYNTLSQQQHHHHQFNSMNGTHDEYHPASSHNVHSISAGASITYAPTAVPLGGGYVALRPTSAGNDTVVLNPDATLASEPPAMPAALIRSSNPFKPQPGEGNEIPATLFMSKAAQLAVLLDKGDHNAAPSGSGAGAHAAASFQHGYTSADLAEWLRLEGTYAGYAEAEWLARAGAYLEGRATVNDFVKSVRRRMQGKDPLTGIVEPLLSLSGSSSTTQQQPLDGTRADVWDPVLVPLIQRYFSVAYRTGLPPVYGSLTKQQQDARDRLAASVAEYRQGRHTRVTATLDEQWAAYEALYSVDPAELQARKEAQEAKGKMLVRHKMNSNLAELQLEVRSRAIRQHAKAEANELHRRQKLLAGHGEDIQLALDKAKARQELEEQKARDAGLNPDIALSKRARNMALAARLMNANRSSGGGGGGGSGDLASSTGPNAASAMNNMYKAGSSSSYSGNSVHPPPPTSGADATTSYYSSAAIGPRAGPAGAALRKERREEKGR